MKISVAFIGGANRVTLAEKILKISKPHCDVSFFSLEKDEDFYPISSLAKVIATPKFQTQEFDEAILKFLNTHENPILIACMDAAVPTLAKYAGLTFGQSKIIGPTLEGAHIGLNKKETANFLKKQGIAQPKFFTTSTEPFTEKVIAKPQEGFGSRGITVFNKLSQVPNELFSTHIVQEFIQGEETTHDLYISQNHSFVAGSRDRLKVTAGEVDHCIARQPTKEEMAIFEKIAHSNLFFGPITIQTIKSEKEIYLIEINARFGGGVTASIEAGVPLVELLFTEGLNLSLPHRPIRNLIMKRARRDFYQYL